MNPDPAQVADALVTTGHWRGPVLDPAELTHLHRAAVDLLRRAGRRASVGTGNALRFDAQVRGDRISWLDMGSDQPFRSWLDRLDRLREELRQELRLPLVATEAMVARYARGAAYARHVDRHRDNDRRLLSTVLYLNPHWHPDDGGRLHLWPESGDPLQITPQGGTLVVFRAELPHAVEPARCSRYSLTAWLGRG